MTAVIRSRSAGVISSASSVLRARPAPPASGSWNAPDRSPPAPPPPYAGMSFIQSRSSSSFPPSPSSPSLALPIFSAGLRRTGCARARRRQRRVATALPEQVCAPCAWPSAPRSPAACAENDKGANARAESTSVRARTTAPCAMRAQCGSLATILTDRDPGLQHQLGTPTTNRAFTSLVWRSARAACSGGASERGERSPSANGATAPCFSRRSPCPCIRSSLMERRFCSPEHSHRGGPHGTDRGLAARHREEEGARASHGACRDSEIAGRWRPPREGRLGRPTPRERSVP
jgi:hypothetical protein